MQSSDILSEEWYKRASQQLVCYEAMFKLLEELLPLEEIETIASKVVKQWKYFANVAAWHVVIPYETIYYTIDGAMGEFKIEEKEQISEWDNYYLTTSLPASILLTGECKFPENPSPPQSILIKRASEILVIPIIRFERAIGVLSVVGRDKPFSDLDNRFIRLFGNYFIDLIFNILLRKKHIDKLIKKATHDSLTGLLNRGAITEHLEKYIELSARTSTPISVLIADLDHFKYINDTFGHLVGDIVLKEVANRLQKCSRSSDYLGRYGGEEFILVLYPCNEEQARIAAERFRSCIANKPVEANNLTIPITISIGTASATGKIKSETLIKLADEALYISKKNGRNRITTLQIDSEKKSYGEE